MEARAFAGRFAPHGHAGAPGRSALEVALRRDGEATALELGPLTVAWTPPAEGTRAPARCVCLIDGMPRTESLAELLRLDPALPADELVATGYEEIGARVLQRIDGQYAVLVWDREQGTGLLARDRLGARPLFLAEAGGALLFASEIRNLLALLPASPTPDPIAVAQWLARTTAPGTRTLYSGIERLGAGEALALRPDGWRRSRHWSPRYGPPRDIGAAQAAAEVRDALGRAVARSLEGASTPAVMLSGGLDSATVAAVARDGEAGTALAAYSSVFPDDAEVDESAAIARVRDWLGLDGVESRFRSGSALAAAAEFLREWEVPSVSPNLFVWLPLMRRAAADGVDAMLDGEGGDELFGCARYLVADRLRRGRPLAALKTARRLPGMGDSPERRWLARALNSYGVRAALPYAPHERLRTARGRGTAGPAWLSPEAERVHRATEDPWRWKRIAGPRWWAQLAHALTSTADALGAPDQLRRAARLAGVEARHPLRDPELVDLVLSLPPELAFDPHLDRPLARRALAGALPEETLREDRKPHFNSLLSGALAGPDSTALQELLAEPHPELAGRIRRDVVAALLGTGAGGSALRSALGLWRIATLEMWLRHREDPSGDPERLYTEDFSVPELKMVRIPAFPRQVRRSSNCGGSVPP